MRREGGCDARGPMISGQNRASNVKCSIMSTSSWDSFWCIMSTNWMYSKSPSTNVVDIAANSSFFPDLMWVMKFVDDFAASWEVLVVVGFAKPSKTIHKSVNSQ